MLAEITKDKDFATAFFAEYIYGTSVNDYKNLLENAGLLLQKKYPNQSYLNRCKISFKKGEGGEIVSGTFKGSPLYKAGLDRGDVLTAINGKALTTMSSLQNLIKNHQVGDIIEVSYLHRGLPLKTKVELLEDYHLEVITYESAKLKVNKKVRDFRENWLSSKVKVLQEDDK